MKRNLTPLELEQLCDLFGKMGDRDLLDFLDFVKRNRGKLIAKTDEQLLQILKHFPTEDELDETC